MSRRHCRLLVLVCFSGVFATSAQTVTTMDPVHLYPFIQWEQNQIEFSGCLESYAHAIKDLINGSRNKVRIVHIGDSHIQADYLTHSARVQLQRAYGNGGRGFIFPYSIIGSNSPGSVRVVSHGTWEGCVSTSNRKICNYGFSGASATTYDSLCTLIINPNKQGDMYYDFNRVDLFHLRNHDELELSLAQTPMDMIPRSSSISSIYLPEYRDSLMMQFTRNTSFQTYFQLYGLSLETSLPGLIYHSVGLNGASVQSVQKSLFFDEQIAFLAPDLVIISLGTNDGYMPGSRFCRACFIDTYTALIKRIRANNPNSSILLSTPGDYVRRLRYQDPHQMEIVEAIRDLALEQDCALWDLNQIMGGRNSIRKWVGKGLANTDLVHYTESGYRLQGELLFRALLQAESSFGDPEIVQIKNAP